MARKTKSTLAQAHPSSSKTPTPIPQKRPYKRTDALYHAIFSVPILVEILLKSFTKGLDIDAFDFSTLTLESPKVQGQNLKKRRGDLLFSLQRKDHGPPVYIFVVLEFQSRADSVMAFRLLEYTGMIYKRLWRSKRFHVGNYPEILTLVLYNGAKPWHAPLDVWGYLTPMATSRRQDSPQLRYQLIPILHYEESFLSALHNPVGCLMLMEKHASEREVLEDLARQVDDWVQHENQEPVREVFQSFLWELSRQGRAEEIRWERTGLASGVEVMHMGLAKGIKTIHDELFREGQKEGREEGREEGNKEGQREGLRRAVQSILSLKFGSEGLQFWENELEDALVSDWMKILECAVRADTLVGFCEKVHPILPVEA